MRRLLLRKFTGRVVTVVAVALILVGIDLLRWSARLDREARSSRRP